MPSGSRQRHAQLVADHAEKLGALALQLLERREVLHGDHHRGDGAVLGVDRGGVDQRGHAAPVGDRERDLLGAHRLAAAQRARERELVEGDLAPVGAPVGDDLEQLLRRLAGGAQALDDPPGLAVVGRRVPALPSAGISTATGTTAKRKNAPCNQPRNLRHHRRANASWRCGASWRKRARPRSSIRARTR